MQATTTTAYPCLSTLSVQLHVRALNLVVACDIPSALYSHFFSVNTKDESYLPVPRYDVQLLKCPPCMSDRNIVNAGSAESRNVERECVSVMARCCTLIYRLLNWVNGDGLLWKRLSRSS